MITERNIQVARARMPGPTGQHGFALVCAIWITGLVGVLALTFSLQARTYIALGRNSAANAQARFMADAGVMLAIHELSEMRYATGRMTTWRPGTRQCRMPGGSIIRITITDEAGRIDLNTVDDDVLLALLRGVGFGSNRAQELRDKLLDYRDGDRQRRPFGGEALDYSAAGLHHRPRNGSLLSVEELGQVLGYDAETISRLQPHVTVNSGHSGIDPTRASPTLVSVLAEGARNMPAAAESFNGSLPQSFISISTNRTFRVKALAQTPTKSRFLRETAFTMLDDSLSRAGRRSNAAADALPIRSDLPVKFWSWGQEFEVAEDPAVPSEGVLNCSPQT